MKLTNYIPIISILFINISCTQRPVEPVRQQSDKKKENLIKINKYLVEVEDYKIDEYNKRNNLSLSKTESGLRYEIFKKGKGEKIKKNSIVLFNYRVQLIDGTLCYSSDSLGMRRISINHEAEEKGLQEGLELLSVGDSAIFIVPSHLGYGLLGDNKCIPPRAILVYFVKVIGIEK